MTAPVFIGVDVGTGGVRALAVTATGEVVARTAASLDAARIPRPPGRHEQAPLEWWRAVCAALQRLMHDLRELRWPPGALQAVAVDGTSGTLVCLDGDGQPLRPAIMYNDGRAGTEADYLNGLAGAFRDKLGYRFAASFSLAKIEWVRTHEPELFHHTRRFLHQSDFIEGRLCDDFTVSDYSNALKTGYDLVDECWPGWLAQLEGVAERLPRVAAPGDLVGAVGAWGAAETGLPRGLAVVAGATDGTAACVAAGADKIGDYATTLGTTLVFKGMSDRLARHPDGLLYSHKLPAGRWLPGAASNTGGEWIQAEYAGRNLRQLDAAAAGHLPSSAVAYPLVRQGERFPFKCDRAEGFCVSRVSGVARFAARLQGTAFVERLGYQVIDAVTRSGGGTVYSTGGGSRSDIWSQCRADVTGRLVRRPAVPESAFGSAVLAAAGATGRDVWEVAGEMVSIEATFEPDPARVPAYEELYQRFVLELKTRGWL